MRSRPSSSSRAHRAVGAAILTTAAFLAGCGDKSPRIPEGSAQALAPAERLADDGRPAGAPTGEGTAFKVIREPGAFPADRIPLEWTALGAGKSSDAINVSWTYGSCGNKDFHVYLVETPTQVVIDLWNDPDFTGDCIALGNPGATTVKLAAPLGRRELLQHRVEPPPIP